MSIPQSALEEGKVHATLNKAKAQTQVFISPGW